MADAQKKNYSVSSKEKNSMLDLDIGNDFLSSWKSISIAEGDAMDFDLTPGNKKSFKFDKADMDFTLDGDFGKMPSFNMDMSDLDISPPLKEDGKPKEQSKESSSGKDKGRSDRFAFAFDFDELDNFNFESNITKEGSKASNAKSKKESPPSVSECQDEAGSVNMKQIGSMVTLEDGPQKLSRQGTVVTFDMDSLVGGGAELDPRNENYCSDLATNDAVTLENSASIHEVASDKSKSHPETKIAKELPKAGRSEKLVSAERVEIETCTENDTVQDLSSDSLSKSEPTGGNSLEAQGKVNSANTNTTGSYGKRDVNVISINSSSSHYKQSISQNSRYLQTVEVSEKNNGEKIIVGVEDHVINNRERTEPGQVKSFVQNSCTDSAVPEILCEKPPGKKNHEPAPEFLKLPLINKPSDLSEKEAEKGREPFVTCLKPFVQSEKSKFPVPEALKQTMFSLLSSNKIGFTQPNPVEGRRLTELKSSNLLDHRESRDKDNTQSDKKLVSLPLQNSKTLLKELPQIQRHESCRALKISREVYTADGLENAKKLNDSSITQNKEMANVKSVLGQREASMQNFDTLRNSCASFPLEVNKNAAQNSGHPKPLAALAISENNPAEECKPSSVDCGRRTPDIPGQKLPSLNIDSIKSLVRKDMKPMGNIGQNRALLRKTPYDTAHFPNSQKQTPSTLSTKRKTLEEDAENLNTLHPFKRLQSPNTGRNIVETSEKILDEKVSSNVETKCIKSTAVDPETPTYHIPHEVKIKEVVMSFSIESDNNIKQAEAYAKELDHLCNMLKKKHDEAKEMLVRAVVNSNKLLMLDNPILDEKVIIEQCPRVKSSA